MISELKALLRHIVLFVFSIKLSELQSRNLILVAMVAATISMKKVRHRWQRRSELDEWIQLARKQRDHKVHNVLMIKDENDIEDVSKNRLLTAADTRLLIASGKLDPKKNVEQLAKRCRKYGGAVDGINAVTEEFYDEVSFLLVRYFC